MTLIVESERGPTKALPRPRIAILNIVGVIALLDELVVRGSVRAREGFEGFILRSAELQPTYVAMSFFSLDFFYLSCDLYPKHVDVLAYEVSSVELETLLGSLLIFFTA